MATPTTPPGWYPDPRGSGGQRYWDGAQWTADHAPPAGPAPYVGPPQYPAVPPSTPTVVSPAPPTWFAMPAAFVVLVAGCIGPWLKSGSASVGGLDKDGSVLLGIGVVVAILIGSWVPTGVRALPWIAFGLSLLGALIAVIDLGDINNNGLGIVDPGWGIYVALIGSLALAVVSLMLGLVKRRS